MIKQRYCLKCQIEFKSRDFGHRFCKLCRKSLQTHQATVGKYEATMPTVEKESRKASTISTRSQNYHGK